jgi:predicted RNA-binding Zn ribbon-like protein
MENPAKPVLMVTPQTNQLPPIVQLPLAGDRLCLDFVNTIDWRLRPEKYRDTLLAYSDLLAFALRLNIISTDIYTELSELALKEPHEAERSTADARAFRDALATVIDDIAGTPAQAPKGGPQQEALAIIDAARRRAHETETLSWDRGRLILVHHPEEERFDRPWLIIVRDAEELLRSSRTSRIRVCAADGCGWAFLDTSKNGARRWCSMKLCGNRAKAERFRNRSTGVQEGSTET